MCVGVLCLVDDDQRWRCVQSACGCAGSE
jgi:hypothetical protein